MELILTFTDGAVPNLRKGTMEYFLVRWRLPHDASPGARVLGAYYLNAYPLEYEDRCGDCDNDDTCPMVSGGAYPTTGWFTERADYQSDTVFEPLHGEVVGFASPRELTPLTEGAAAIARERARQITEIGYDALHDAQYTSGDLAWAAGCYLQEAASHAETGRGGCPLHGRAPEAWPWDPRNWKPSDDQRRNLAKAGALIAAEIERLDLISHAQSA